MAKTLSLSGQFASTTAVPNIDSYYGPYQNKTDVINTLVGDGSRSKAANGLTVGIFENGSVVDYAFQNVVSGQIPTETNLIKKISNATITIKQEGQDPQTFTLNQGENVTITLSKGVSTWNEIEDKPTFATVATSGSYNDLSNRPSNLVYFD